MTENTAALTAEEADTLRMLRSDPSNGLNHAAADVIDALTAQSEALWTNALGLEDELNDAKRDIERKDAALRELAPLVAQARASKTSLGLSGYRLQDLAFALLERWPALASAQTKGEG